MTVAKMNSGGAASSTRGLMMGGKNPSTQDTIDYITIATLGNAIDFGNTTNDRSVYPGCSSSTRAVWAGGYAPTNSNIMDYVQIPTTGNASDFGDLDTSKHRHSAASNGHGGLG